MFFENWPTSLALWTVALGFGLAGYLLGRHAAWWAPLPLLLLFLGIWVPVQESELADAIVNHRSTPADLVHWRFAVVVAVALSCLGAVLRWRRDRASTHAPSRRTRLPS